MQLNIHNVEQIELGYAEPLDNNPAYMRDLVVETESGETLRLVMFSESRENLEINKAQEAPCSST